MLKLSAYVSGQQLLSHTPSFFGASFEMVLSEVQMAEAPRGDRDKLGQAIADKTKEDTMSATIDMKELLEAGVHFGHQTRRWNPKMKPFIFTQRDGIHIINLGLTVEFAQKAYQKALEVVASGKSVLFVGTKKQAREMVKQEAERAGQFYVVNRWMGGTLTNYQTIKGSIDRLKSMEERQAKGELSLLIKKEALNIERTIEKLLGSLGGIKEMKKQPGLVFIIDPEHEKNAKLEAIKLNIPIVAMVDTNCNPDGIDFPIPANDDAIRSIQIFVTMIADACLEGAKIYEARTRETQQAAAQNASSAGKPAVREQKMTGQPKARVYTADRKPDAKGSKSSGKKAEATTEEATKFSKATPENVN